MPDASVALNAHQPPHISFNTFFQIIPNQVLGKQFAKGVQLSLAKISNVFVFDTELADNVMSLGTPNAMDMLKSILEALLIRDFTSNTTSYVYILCTHAPSGKVLTKADNNIRGIVETQHGLDWDGRQ